MTEQAKTNGLGLVLKDVFKHSIVYGITSSLQSVVGFVLLPILTSYISPDLFGVYSILLLMAALTSAIFYLGASSALGRFYFDEDGIAYRRAIVSTAFFVTVFGALLLIGLAIGFADTISYWLFSTKAYSLHVILSLSGSAVGFLLNLMAIILRYQKKSVAFLTVSSTGLVINFVVTYYLLTRANYQILAPIYGSLISNGFCFVLLLLLSLKFIRVKFDGRYFKSILSFGIQASAIGLLFYILEWVDRLIIKELLDLKSVGIYSLGYRIAALVNILFVTPFSLIWAPTRMEYARKENAKALMTKISSYYSAVGVLFVLSGLLFGNDVMQVLFKNHDYHEAAQVFPIVMLANLLFGYQNILDIGIHISKKLYFYIIISVLSITINIGLNYLLIPVFGYMAAAYVTLLTYLFSATASYLIANRYYRIHLEPGRLISLFVCTLAVYLFAWFFRYQVQPVFFVLKLLVFGVLIIFFYRYWLRKEEHAYVAVGMKRLRGLFLTKQKI